MILDPAELFEITGYSQPAKQLAELRRQGFHRARRNPTTGGVILTRAHYDAVETGADRPKTTPRLHLVRT